ncbi:hypothetical protein ICU98_06885 [Polynucleobacter sp. MWH-P3-07-1]|uniref:hypothetical protein n=1 Tax=Polynucleobacter sp. MWH-P3-07-1 TaxID=1743173 RepID=UPI001BFD7A75|nr:hypothetical protein [Polynucleobacter sp. MWH-P3-07-1]QWD83154.1 hypothetical protein ICU98_06885 [Polynucleobacter sp. MWH-P3-07-1]
MSRSWLWGQEDDLKVVDWVGKASKEALLNGDTSLASEILKGASNFFAPEALVGSLGGNSELVSNWLYDIYSMIYSGTRNISHPEIEPIQTHHSVINCFRLLNSFFDLNDLHTPRLVTLGEPIPDLIIPEPYSNDGIVG